MSAFKKIVCATDFSATSVEALDFGMMLARDTGAEVHVIHVVPDPLTQPWIVEGAGMDFGELRDTWVADAEAALKKLCVDRHIDSRVTQAVLMGTPAAEIQQYVADHGADLIVVGSHGHGAVRRFLLGSVADRVFKTASCPVLVVPHRTLRPAVAETTEPREVAVAT